MPDKKNAVLRFKKYEALIRKPYVIYADFESLLVPVQGCENAHDKSSTEIKKEHVPCGFAYVIVGQEGLESSPVQCYRGPDAVTVFLQKMMEEEQRLLSSLTKVMIYTMAAHQTVYIYIYITILYIYKCQGWVNTWKCVVYSHI
jgi:hypothetical protein